MNTELWFDVCGRGVSSIGIFTVYGQLIHLEYLRIIRVEFMSHTELHVYVCLVEESIY